MADNNPPVPVPSQTIDLVGRQTLELMRHDGHEQLRIVGSDGRVRLTIIVTPDGPVLQFEGGGLTIQAEGDLAIDAENIHLHARKNVSVSSDGDTDILAAGDLTTSARSQEIKAELGNVNVKANDDVSIKGERIKMNC